MNAPGAAVCWCSSMQDLITSQCSASQSARQVAPCEDLAVRAKVKFGGAQGRGGQIKVGAANTSRGAWAFDLFLADD